MSALGRHLARRQRDREDVALHHLAADELELTNAASDLGESKAIKDEIGNV